MEHLQLVLWSANVTPVMDYGFEHAIAKLVVWNENIQLTPERRSKTDSIKPNPFKRSYKRAKMCNTLRNCEVKVRIWQFLVAWKLGTPKIPFLPFGLSLSLTVVCWKKRSSAEQVGRCDQWSAVPVEKGRLSDQAEWFPGDIEQENESNLSIAHFSKWNKGIMKLFISNGLNFLWIPRQNLLSKIQHNHPSCLEKI